jgi:hypothetical protein
VQNKIREQARDTLSEHGLADSRRAKEEHVVPTRRGSWQVHMAST